MLLLKYSLEVRLTDSIFQVFSISTCIYCINYCNLVLLQFLGTLILLSYDTAPLLGFPGGSVVKNTPAKQETLVQSLDWEDPLEKEMATHPSILAPGNTVDRGAWQAIVHGVSESDTT